MTVIVSTDPNYLAQVAKATPKTSYRRTKIRLAIVVSINFAYSIEQLFVHGLSSWPAYFQFALGGVYLLYVAHLMKRLKIRVFSAETKVTIDESGLTIEPSGEVTSWQGISEARDVGGLDGAPVFIRASNDHAIAIVKASLPENGVLLWTQLFNRPRAIAKGA